MNRISTPMNRPASTSPQAARLAVLGLLLGLTPLAQATNGMLLEGYGPVAAGMGGVAMASDNGLAAAANNPATLGLMPLGSSRLDLAIGRLGPQVSSSAGPMDASSSGRNYVMPAFGYGRRDGALSWGVAVFAQGGMGTDYAADSFLAMGSGKPVRSELGVGRAMVPLSWQATPELTLGGSVDLVWGSLDMRMAASGAMLGSMVTGASGNLAMALPALGGAPWARVDFSDSSHFTGAAHSVGHAFKLGALYQVAPDLRAGISYHSRSHLGNMRTGANGAELSAFGGFSDTGRIEVVDFQMPAQWGAGLAWDVSPQWQVAADVRRIGWSDVMSSFRLNYTSAGMGGGFSMAMPQMWKDQTTVQLGTAWKASPEWTWRAGLNIADNPVPNTYVNPLFPATVSNHYSLGAGYQWARDQEVNFAVTRAQQQSVTTPGGIEIRHSQLNAQVMYSQRF